MATDRDERKRRIRAAREYAGLTQDDLARALGVSLSTASRLENPNWKKPVRVRDLFAVATATGMPVEFFFVDFARFQEIATVPTGGEGDLPLDPTLRPGPQEEPLDEEERDRSQNP